MQQPQVISAEEQRLADTIADFGNELIHVSPQDIPTVTEDFFVRVFLPVFAGDEINPHNATPLTWLSVAKSPFAEVRIVDAKGVELFLVPPMMDSGVVQPLSDNGNVPMPSITDMMTRARLVGKQGTAAMNRYISEEFAKRNYVKSTEHDKNIFKRWLEIFKRYDRLPADLVFDDQSGAATTGVTVRPTDLDSQEFDSLPE